VTELAYLPDVASAYVRSFESKVVALPPGGVVLDRTYLYPAGGGQPADRGTLRSEGGEWSVVDVARTGGSVIHRLRALGPGPRTPTLGSSVEAEIDWPRRYRHMRLHTAQHLLSARVFTRTGLRTAKAQMAGVAATLDLEGPLEPTQIPALEGDLAATLVSPRPVRIRLVPRATWDQSAEAPRSGLVPLPTHVDPVRVIEIDAEDACPCGGTHLRSTGEIGAVQLAFGPSATGPGRRLTLTLTEADRPTPIA
jgi:misacylated tRNA(Ala) deacylase